MAESVQALMHSYHFIRGKSYNDRLVFSPHFTGQVLSMFRAFSRFGNVTLVGPKGMRIIILTCYIGLLILWLTTLSIVSGYQF